MFIGVTDTEAEVLILWPPDAKSWLIGKDPDAGKDWGQEKKGTTEDEMAGWHHWLSRHAFELALGDSEGQGAWRAAAHGCRVWHDWAAEQQQQMVRVRPARQCSSRLHKEPVEGGARGSSVHRAHLHACVSIVLGRPAALAKPRFSQLLKEVGRSLSLSSSSVQHSVYS